MFEGTEAWNIKYFLSALCALALRLCVKQKSINPHDVLGFIFLILVGMLIYLKVKKWI